MAQSIGRNIFENLKEPKTIVIFALIFIGAFVAWQALVVVAIYMLSSAIWDTYIVFKSAWDTPDEARQLLLEDRGFGIPLIFMSLGLGSWFYLHFELEYFQSLLTQIPSLVLIGILIPSLLASTTIVVGIQLITEYRGVETVDDES